MHWCQQCYRMVDKCANDALCTETKIHIEEVLYPTEIITLEKEDFERLQKMLDGPPEANEKLKELMKSKPQWEK